MNSLRRSSKEADAASCFAGLSVGRRIIAIKLFINRQLNYDNYCAFVIRNKEELDKVICKKEARGVAVSKRNEFLFFVAHHRQSLSLLSFGELWL